VVHQINDLRKLSIHVVDTIVMWREQFRYIAGMSGSQSKNLRRLSQSRLSFLVPAVNEDGNTSTNPAMINYLIKMKSDTSHFGQLEIGRFFSFCEKTRSDPFLITTGLSQQPKAVGSGITAMYGLYKIYDNKPISPLGYSKHRQKSQQEKVIVPLPDNLINKAKAW
jgi:hypothetical protein